MNKNKTIQILKDNKVIGIVGSTNTSKTTTLNTFLNTTLSNKLIISYIFCYHQEQRDLIISNLKKKEQKQIKFFSSIEELESIQDGFIFIDEFHKLFNLENRAKKNLNIIKTLFNQIHHNNNRVILCSTPENYNKYISSICDGYMITKLKFNELINGSGLKSYIEGISTNIKGVTAFHTPLYKVFYKGEILTPIYNKKQDKKKDNKDLFQGFNNKEVKND